MCWSSSGVGICCVHNKTNRLGAVVRTPRWVPAVRLWQATRVANRMFCFSHMDRVFTRVSLSDSSLRLRVSHSIRPFLREWRKFVRRHFFLVLTACSINFKYLFCFLWDLCLSINGNKDIRSSCSSYSCVNYDMKGKFKLCVIIPTLNKSVTWSVRLSTKGNKSQAQNEKINIFQWHTTCDTSPMVSSVRLQSHGRKSESYLISSLQHSRGVKDIRLGWILQKKHQQMPLMASSLFLDGCRPPRCWSCSPSHHLKAACCLNLG